MGGDDGEIPVAVADGETLVLQVAPFGLVIESADGRALLPLEHDLEFHEATRQRERLSFAMLQDEVARAADDE